MLERERRCKREGKNDENVGSGKKERGKEHEECKRLRKRKEEAKRSKNSGVRDGEA